MHISRDRSRSRIAPLIIAAPCLALGCAASHRAQPAHPPTLVEGFTLAFSDEFDTDGPPNPAHWIPETGFVRNRELQWYQLANANCANGTLILEARRERVANPSFDSAAPSSDWKRSRAHADYTSASIKTKGLHAWTFGRFEMRARIDIRDGLWPAFWTVGSGSANAPARAWPANGEIDIMEFYRSTLLANAAWASERSGAAQWDDVKVPIEDVARRAGFPDARAWAREFHIWRADWDEHFIRHSVDGALLNEIDLSRTINATPDHANPFHEPHHIILNLAVGGTSGGDPSRTELPARFEIDWVRVYQRPAQPAR